MTMLLDVRDLEAFYGDFQALYGTDIHISEGEIIALIGANGAGKSTFLNAITGMLRSKTGHLTFKGQDIGTRLADEIHRAGIAVVPEGRRLFPSLSVEENLLVGAAGGREGPWTLKRIYEFFPDLVEKRHNPGTALSGGQQQMVAIGRALMSNPDLLLCDELSLGLSPKVVREIYTAVPRIRDEGTTMLVVEQDVNQALAVSSRIYCFMEGRITLSGAPGEFTRQQVAAAYFGTAAEGDGMNVL